MKLLVLTALVLGACVSSSSSAPPPKTSENAAGLAGGRLQVKPEAMIRVDDRPRQIVPDDMTRFKMARANVVSVSGLFLVCVDVKGHVEAVDVLATTSLADYDAKVQKRIHEFVYTPYVGEAGPQPVCMPLVVEYAQDPKDAPRVERR